MIGHNPALDVYLGRQLIASIHLINDQLSWTYSASWCEKGYAVSPHVPLVGDISSLKIKRF